MKKSKTQDVFLGLMKKFKRADTYWESETERQGKPVWPQEVDNESITMYERLNILNE